MTQIRRTLSTTFDDPTDFMEWLRDVTAWFYDGMDPPLKAAFAIDELTNLTDQLTPACGEQVWGNFSVLCGCVATGFHNDSTVDNRISGICHPHQHIPSYSDADTESMIKYLLPRTVVDCPDIWDIQVEAQTECICALSPSQ